MRDAFKELFLQYPDALVAFVVGLGLATALTLAGPDIPQAAGLAGWIAMAACIGYSFSRVQGA